MDSDEDVRLTTFRPLSPDSSKSSFSLARFFQWKRHGARVEVKVDASKSQRPVSPLTSPRSSPILQKRTKSPEPLQRSWSASPLISRRSSAQAGSSIHSRRASPGHVHAVLGRLNAAAGGRGQLRQEYKESDFKQYWMPDENCKECYECSEKFNTFRRRHHCRLCGQIFCYRCCSLEIPGQIMGYTGFLRVCTYCHKVVQRYTQSSDLNVVRNLEQLQAVLPTINSESDLSTTNPSNMTMTVPKPYPFDFDDEEHIYIQPLLRKASGTGASGAAGISYYEKFDQKERPSPMSGRRPFDAFGVCAAEADMLKQDSFRELWNQIMSSRSGLELQSHRFRLRTYQNCFVGSELVDWLLTHEKTSTRNQAVMIGQGLLESGWLEPVPNTRDGGAVFKDEYVLYQPGVVASREVLTKKSSLLWTETEKLADKNESLSESDDIISEHVDDDNDETVPHWFRQLEQHGVESASEEFDASFSQELPGKPNNVKTGPKLLDLDLMNGVTSEEGNSELSLKVDLQHFGEPGKIGVTSQVTQSEVGGSKLSLITDVPPPPLEQYVYNEGYPYTPLRPSNKKNQEETVLSTSNVPDEIFSGAMMARAIGVNRPSAPEIGSLREDNGERLAMERLRAAHAYHLNTLLEQLLKDAGLSVDWKDTILPIVKIVCEQVTPDVRKGDDMDICEYVKFKKIPGGNKCDCKMISGVVFTKNIANKKMASVLSNPKILVLSCAIDYQRNENRLASLDPLVLQEFEFLKNFVARVVSLRPNILLVEKTVSRLAQDMLLQHGITLVLNVKPEVIGRIARCTRADVLCSMEQLSRPQLGSCQSFRVQRYTLKNGESKTLMFIDGCPADLFCTVNLRGGNSFVLAKVKRIFQHMVYVAYSLRLELQFLMDEFALPPDTNQLIQEWEVAAKNFERKMKTDEGEMNKKENNGEDSSEQKKNLADMIQQDSSEGSEFFLTALKSIVLASSPFLDYPLPYLLTEAGRNMALRSTLPADIYWSARLDPDTHSRHLTEEGMEEFDFSTPHQRRLSKLVCMLGPHPLLSASLTMDPNDVLFQALVSDFRAQGGQIQLTKNGMAVSRGRCKWLEGVGEKNVTQSKKGKTCLQETSSLRINVPERTNEEEKEEKDQFVPTTPLHFNRKQVDCLDPYAHQRIAVLFISYSNESNNSPRPCISPWAVFMEFYGRNDITLGGFLEIYCFRPSYICPNPNCDIPMVDHVRYFAHGTGSVYIHMRNLESPIPGFQHTILTWSWCKECKQVTPIVPLSPEAWALSFAKYLELRFYAGSYKRRASVEPCGHSLHKDHYQYFAYANMVASFKYRPIKLFEIAIPCPRIYINEKTRDASLWISDLRAIATRGETVFAAVFDRLESLKDFSTQPDRHVKIQQFLVALDEEHTRFLEQVEIVEKKAASIQEPETPLAMENADSCEHLGPEDRQALEYVIANSLNSLKKTLCEVVESWNNTLQEYFHAEKKKNNKSMTSSTREGKLMSSVQLDGKSSTEQLSKSIDLQGVRGVGLNAQEGNLTPSQTPWGSRSPSPYPSPDTNEDSPEVLSGPDVEVMYVTSGFRPISSTERDVSPPADSPTEGILPVGGVVKGHSLPVAKNEPLAKVCLERNLTERQRSETLKAFVVIEAKSEKPVDCILSNVKGNVLAEDLDGKEEPCEGKMDDVKEPSMDKMDDPTEPSGIKVNDAKEPIGDSMAGIKEPSGVRMDDNKSKEFSTENAKSINARSDDVLTGEKGPPGGSMEETKHSSWYIIEGLNGQEETVGEGTPTSEGDQTTSQGQIFTSAETKREDKGTERGVLGKPLMFGHRRVASSPPAITITSVDRTSLSGGEIASGVTYLERSRSDSDIHTCVKQELDESVMSTEDNLENLDEDDIDGSGQIGKEKIAESSDAEDSIKERSLPEFRKVDTIPSAQHKRSVARSQSWAVNQWQATAKKAVATERADPDITPTPDGLSGTSKRGKVKHIISSFMSSSAFQPVASTFPIHEHHLLPPGEKLLVVVSEKETSSIIAYTLSTKEYNECLHDIQRTLSEIMNGATREFLQSKRDFGKSVDASLKGQPQVDIPQGSDKFIRVDSNTEANEGYVNMEIVNPETESGTRQDGDTASVIVDKLEFMSNSQECHAVPDSQSTHPSKNSQVERVLYTKVKHTAAQKEEMKKAENIPAQDTSAQDDTDLVQFGFQRKDASPAVDFHFKHQFADNTCRFYCSIYFAEQFRLLRKRIFPDGEEKYIRSLQHSVAWGAQGGKSGSAFFKSLDDRFVMKQMSRQELQCFLEFAPHYFRYINKALDEQRPTLLAKILGIYRIGYKNSQTSATMRQDVLVMENLFYDRKIDKTFDLKGSMRSRYVQTSGLKNDVLLDENLLEMIRECPIFFRPHSKAILSRAIHNDTEFLAQQMVMDYSLLVGIDEARSELVTGIIDFIRTFTWDKKLEMYVKASGILGGQGRMPTVVSPELYRTRFTEAMHRYFLMVPDKWTGLGNDLD